MTRSAFRPATRRRATSGSRLDTRASVAIWKPSPRDEATAGPVPCQRRCQRLNGQLAVEAKRRIEEIPGLVDAWSSSESGGMELYVDLDRELAARYGVPLNQPAEVVSLTFRGRRLQRFRTPEGEREMRLTLDERADETVSQLRNLPVWTAEGDKIPLAAMADFRHLACARAVGR